MRLVELLAGECAMTDRDVDAAVEQLRETAITMRGDRKRGDPNDAYSALADEIDLVCDALVEARQQLAAQAQEIARLQEELDRTVRCTDDCERVRKQDVQDAADAQRERAAQICREYAGRLRENGLWRDADVADECAIFIEIKDARTPQEPA